MVENFISIGTPMLNLPSDNGGATRGLLEAVETICLIDLPLFTATAARQDSSHPMVPERVQNDEASSTVALLIHHFSMTN